MDEGNTASPSTEDAPSHEAQVDHYITQMKRIQNRLADDREEILILQAETRAILDDVMVTLKAEIR